MKLEAFLSKSFKAKTKFIKDRITEDYKSIIYICPKKYRENVIEAMPDNVLVFHYEDLNKTNRLYDVLCQDSLLILDGSSRYKSINSMVFKRLERLAEIPNNKIMVDNVPFTTSVEYAYIPYSHLERAILGYQHFYSFRENNQEYNEKGELTTAHDFDLLTDKVKGITKIDYREFMPPEYTVIRHELSSDELKEYNKYRDSLLEEYTTIQPVLTRLADFVNTLESRLKHLYEVVSRLEGNIFIYTNIKSHNRKIKRMFKDMPNVKIKTFYDHNENEHLADNIVLAEVPIMRGYLFLDIIANAKKAKFHFITGDSTIDTLLFDRMIDEISQINKFTRLLYDKQNNEDIKEVRKNE